MTSRQQLNEAATCISGMTGHRFQLLSIDYPDCPEEVVERVKTISKLSPLLGNKIEMDVVKTLNAGTTSKWERQDPGFPDAKLCDAEAAGIEFKAWYPFATEITARFKSSKEQLNDSIDVCLLAWMPEGIVFGRPILIDSVVMGSITVAAARDKHYHLPPGYLVVEPEDTSGRTANLQQTNASGYKWQGTDAELEEAQIIVDNWLGNSKDLTDHLLNTYRYRLDTNFGKIDRIEHPEIEGFKKRVMETEFRGRTIGEWGKLMKKPQKLFEAISDLNSSTHGCM